MCERAILMGGKKEIATRALLGRLSGKSARINR